MHERSHMGMIVHLTATKQSRDGRWVPVHAWTQKIMHSWAVTSSASTHVPFDTHSHALQTVFWPHLCTPVLWSKLGLTSPVNLGGGEPCPISSVSAPIQVGVSSVSGPISLPSESVSALRLMADHTKEIFNLACEGCISWRSGLWEFTKLSSQEVLFHTQAQSTGYEMLASRHPDRFTAYYMILQSNEESTEAKDKAIEELLNRASEAWLQTNMSLFKHVLDYEVKLDVFLDRAGGWIRVHRRSTSGWQWLE